MWAEKRSKLRKTARRRWRCCGPTSRIDLLVTDVGLPGGMNGEATGGYCTDSAAEPEGAVHHRLRGTVGDEWR